MYSLNICMVISIRDSTSKGLTRIAILKKKVKDMNQKRISLVCVCLCVGLSAAACLAACCGCILSLNTPQCLANPGLLPYVTAIIFRPPGLLIHRAVGRWQTLLHRTHGSQYSAVHVCVFHCICQTWQHMWLSVLRVSPPVLCKRMSNTSTHMVLSSVLVGLCCCYCAWRLSLGVRVHLTWLWNVWRQERYHSDFKGTLWTLQDLFTSHRE